MTTIQTAFENHMHGKADFRKRVDGTYVIKATYRAFQEFKVIYEIGFSAGQCEPRYGARPPMGEALRELASQAKTMGMGYGD
jgi:hypothetical protein